MRHTGAQGCLLFIMLVALPGISAAQAEVVASIDWSLTNTPEGATLEGDDNEGAVIEINVNHREIMSLWSVTRPQVVDAEHAIRGRMRVQSASGEAQFEMWTCFGDDGDWYSRAPIQISGFDGGSEWIDFEVPFDLGGDYELEYPPHKMLLTLDLPDGGLLWISNLSLVQY